MRRFLCTLKAALVEMLRPTFPADDDPQSTAEATAARTRWIKEHRPGGECRGADFSRAAWALGQGLIDHADRDGLTGVKRAMFMDRGGHAPGEACPTVKPADPHKYWCQYPADECSCGAS